MTERIFPHWESFYRERAVETMPWYFAGLDPDFAIELDALGIDRGRVLDIGTGAGTQAIDLAVRGFEVTATDIAEAAIEHARKSASELGVKVQLLVDDVLDSHVQGVFDVVFDRGCFHTLAPDRRPEYVAMVAAHVRVGGHLLLKCFSHLQPGDVGPHKFTHDEITACFDGTFELRSTRQTVYQGTLDPLPLAMCCVLVRRAG
jgi:2-polyprenyl-3-methyl-5-hydroxy-6-metoxy-1,4-benzoquinol methylase